MKYLCLIYLDEKKMDAMPAGEMNALNAEHLAFNEDLRASGHFIEAEALEPARDCQSAGTPGESIRHRWPLRRDEGTGRGVLPDRRTRSERSDPGCRENPERTLWDG